MIYVLVTLVAALTTAAVTRQSPRLATRIGITAVVVAVAAVVVAEITGNLLLFYLGALAGPYGLLVLLIRVIASLRAHDGAGLTCSK